MGEPAASNISVHPASAGSHTPEALARPKVMRRPAHFAHAPVTAPQATTIISDFPSLTSDGSPQAGTAATARAWQDDGRFAIVLLAVVVFTNLAMIAWLGHIRPTAQKGPHIVQDTRMENGTPPSGPSNVAIYTDDAAAPAPEIHLLDGKAGPVSE